MGRICSTLGETRNAYRVLVGKPKRKRPLGRLSEWWFLKKDTAPWSYY
jgi:hypothetical protein